MNIQIQDILKLKNIVRANAEVSVKSGGDIPSNHEYSGTYTVGTLN